MHALDETIPIWGALSDYAADLAHELNQPLATISVLADAGARLIAKLEPTPERAQFEELFARIRNDAQRAGEVVHRHRARVALTGPRTPVPVTRMVEDVATALGLAYAPTSSSAQTASVDPAQIAYALKGLLEIWTSADEPPCIEVEDSIDHDSVVIRIHAARGDRDALVPFFQQDQPDLSRARLAAARGLLEANGGRITVLENRAGCSGGFEVSLPASPHR